MTFWQCFQSVPKDSGRFIESWLDLHVLQNHRVLTVSFIIFTQQPGRSV